MTIQEAIKSGKPFKRPGHDLYLVVFHQMFYVDIPVFDDTEITVPVSAYSPIYIASSAILADDWEVKEDEAR